MKNNRIASIEIGNIVTNHIILYPTPANINFLWSFGSLVGLAFALQLISGIFLSMQYIPNIHLAFNSVEYIMRDVQAGYLMRYAHANGASMIFFLLYLHMFRGLYYGSFINNKLLWWSGLLLFLLMMATAFLGYVLPWGQMSFWGATVITNFITAIPAVGDALLQWLWGGFSIDNPTLNRFYSFHYVLPFVITAIIFGHLIILHLNGSNNPLGISAEGTKIPFYPFFTTKDLFAFLVFIFIFSIIIFFFPNVLGHPDNYINANPMVTPAHIVPEWYFLPFYAVVRLSADKLIGVILMLVAILGLAIFPLISQNKYQSPYFKPIYIYAYWIFIYIFLLLGWIGQQQIGYPYTQIGSIFFLGYFFFLIFLSVILPFFDFLKTTKYVN